jgi:hypothetical protein
MKFISFFLALISSTSFSEGFFIQSKLVSDFLNQFNLNEAVVFYCNSDNIKEWKVLIKTELKFLAFIDTSLPKFDNKFARSAMRLSHRQLGVVFDLTCDETGEVFEDFSRLNFFNVSYNWLMTSENYVESLKLLADQDINLDAEISLAIADESDEIKLYDIYNPNSRTNGKLVSEPKGTWSKAKGMKITLIGDKFERRSNLNDAVINAGVVATPGLMKDQTLKKYMESESIQKFDNIST